MEVEEVFTGWAGFGIGLALTLIGAIAVIILLTVIMGLVGRRKQWAVELKRRARWPFRITVILAGLALSLVFWPIVEWESQLLHAIGIGIIAFGAWLVGEIFIVFVDSGIRKYHIDDKDTFQARRIRTQVQIVRRLVIAIIAIVALGSILMTFDAVRALGASVLASAGIISVVAGLAAQSILGNVFAGIQIAFSEAIRVGDVVVVEGQWGKVNQITLSYVVVEIWDQRTLVLPCTYFTTQPFENWTRLGSKLLGTVEFDLDWRVSVEGMRRQLKRILRSTDLWDGEASGIQVTDATGGIVRVRVLVSAKNSGEIWDLRCLVREELAEWLRSEDRDALPLQRVLVGNTDVDDAPRTKKTYPRSREGLFSGSPEAQARAEAFTGVLPVIDAEMLEAEEARRAQERGEGRR